MCAALQRKGLAGRIAGAGEGEHLPSLSPRHLREDMRRGAEAIQAEVLRIIRLGEGSEADQSRTEERRRLGIAVTLRQRHAVALVGHRILGITAWNMKSREACPVAKVLATAPAVLAFPAGPAEPWNADAGADDEAGRIPAVRNDLSHHLVARGDRVRRARKLAVGDVQVGAAHAAGLYSPARPSRGGRERPRAV